MVKPDARPRHKLLQFPLGAGVAMLLLTGCGATSSDGAKSGNPKGPSTAATTTSTVPPAMVFPPPVIPECGTPITPGPGLLRRLTNEEYIRSVRDIFYLTPDEVSQLQPLLQNDGLAVGNIAEGLRLSPDHLRKYLDVAAKVADFALSTPERRAKFATCDYGAAGDPGFQCRKEFSGGLAYRMFRQALPEMRVWDLEALANRAVPSTTDPDPYRPAKLMVQGLLTSPRFLLRLENPTALASHGWKSITSWDLSVRLSYMLWGTNPDEALQLTARSQQLNSAGQIADVTRKMLVDPRAKEGIGRFINRWLGVELVSDAVRDAATYPEWNDGLKVSMQAETARFMEDFWSKPGLNLLDAFTAKYTYVDDNLAALYGLPLPGPTLTRVDFAANSPRVGFLTQPGVLSASISQKELVAPILRGKFIRKQFLCTLSLPEAPPVVPSPPQDPNLTTRDRLSQHRTNTSCEPCHQLLDPVGFGFEQFDAIGRFRATGSQGEALTGAGQVFGLPGDPTFTGPGELAALLQGSEEVSACLAQQAFRYTYGREPTSADACTITQAREAFKAKKFDLQEMIVAITTSDAFRFASYPGAL
ncbi:MAG: DUF1592 domain-containing protein [Polyangiaceae bacterium]|nr:DUF1592 domain-containing protein [Polyangiaceae bacterium]